MPNYVPMHKVALRATTTARIRVKSDDFEVRLVAGRAGRQVYTVRDGAREASDLEIQKNY